MWAKACNPFAEHAVVCKQYNDTAMDNFEDTSTVLRRIMDTVFSFSDRLHLRLASDTIKNSQMEGGNNDCSVIRAQKGKTAKIDEGHKEQITQTRRCIKGPDIKRNCSKAFSWAGWYVIIKKYC